MMHIVDNSFNYPSSYLTFNANDPFYLGIKERNGVINNNLSVVTSALAENEMTVPENKTSGSTENRIQTKMSNYKTQPQLIYNLSNSQGKALTFLLIRFNAMANPAKSFVDLSGDIHLNTTLSCVIPNAKPDTLNVAIEEMVLSNNEVKPASSVSPINIALEKWNLKVNKWQFSVKEGGIYSEDALLQTSAVDIPVGKFVLRPDLFLMEKFKLDQLTMAGGKIKLENIDTTHAH